MLLFPLATILSSSRVYAQTDAEYDAAMAAIEDGAKYFITTEVDGTRYYLDAGGSLISLREYATVFTLKKVDGGGFKTYGIQVDAGSTRFSNPYSSSSIDDEHLNTSDGSRKDWETQVFFLGENGKYAVRATNAAGTTETSGWNWCGQSFWTVKDGGTGPLAGYSFDVTYVWELIAPGETVKIFTELNTTIERYADQCWDDESGELTNIGPNFGQYSDVETWSKFWNLLQTIYSCTEKFDNSEDHVWTGKPGECPTLAEAEAMTAAADSMWKKIVESEVPYKPLDGYYRIFTAERYSSKYDPSGCVDKAWAASYDKSHENRGVYGTLQRDKANFVWKLTMHGDSILMQNAGMGTYVSSSSYNENCIVMTDDESKAGHFVFDYAGLHEVQFAAADGTVTLDNRHIFAIRPAFEERGGYYIHQLGHGNPVEDSNSPFGYYQTDSGNDLEFSFWARTYNRTPDSNGKLASDTWTSEWYLEPVTDEEAEKLMEDFEIIKNHDVLVAKNKELRAQVLTDIIVAKDDIKTDLITSASQMSSPYSYNELTGGKDGGNLSDGVLIDGDKSTYWHSSYSTVPDDGNHYIQISDIEGMVGDCELYLCQRAATNDHPSKFQVLGSDNLKTEDEDWEVMIDTLIVPNVGSGEENTIPFNITTPYPYIRLVAVDTEPRHSKFWHAAELQIRTVRPNPNSQFVALGAIAENLEKIYNENIAVADADITPEMYNALYDAYRAFLAGMVDPTELRNALATYADLTKGVVEGKEPGQWTSTDIATAFDALYKEVKDYDEAGRYNAVQNHKYSVMLKSMAKSVMEMANGIKTDTWYRLMFPTEEMYTEYGFDPKGAGGDSKIIGYPDQFGYCVTPGVRTDEMGFDEETGKEKATGNYFLEFAKQEDVREGMSLYFADPEELEDPSVSLFRFVERKQDGANYTPVFSEVKENISMALDMSTTYTKGEALITEASQLSSNASDPSEGQHIEYLIDGNINTFWHSDYHKKYLEPGYIQVKLNEPVSGLIQVDMTRRQGASNGHVVRMYVQGSNDGENWTRVGYLETPFTNQNESVTSLPVDLGGSYSYLRFILTNRYGTDGGGNTEFDPFAEITSEDEYNQKWTYFHAAEFQIYPVTADKELSESGKALQQAYATANKVILKDATAEDLTAISQAYQAYRSDFNVEAGKPVLPKGADKATPSYAIQNKATGLFLNCKGAKNANNSLELVPTFFDYKAIGFQRSLIHGTDLYAGDCSYLHSQNFDHRFVTWNSTEPNSNSGLVIREVEAAEPTDFTFYKSIKPGKIYNWCNSVTVTPTPTEDAAAYTCLGRYRTEDGGDFLALKEVQDIVAGQPTFYIYSDTTNYESDADDEEAILFTMVGDQELVEKGDTINGAIGVIGKHTLLPHEIYFSANYPICITKNGYYVYSPKWGVVVDLLSAPSVDPDVDYDFSIYLNNEGDTTDGMKNVATSIQKISQPGAVYSMDGKLLRTNATLNSLKALGKGMYILNGVKVLVK